MAAQTTAGAHARPARPLVSLSLVGDDRLARLIAGNASERAFATLYERYHQPLYRYCRSMLRDDADAQDALQSAFARAFAALRRGQRDAPLRPWLFRIAHNESVSVLRRRRPHEELSELYDGSAASVEEEVEERARLAVLVADLQELPDRQRGALVMRELSGLSHEEIAIALGTSVAAARQTICAARCSLLEFSEGRAMGCEEIRRAISDGDGRALRGRRVRGHLRDCAGCAAFAAAISARRADLRALAPPLPLVAAGGLFARSLGGGSGYGGSGAGGLAGGAVGKPVATALAAKALAAGAIVATATIGVTTVLGEPARAPRRPPAATRAAPTTKLRAAAHSATLRSPVSVAGPAARPGSSHDALGPRALSASSATRAAAGHIRTEAGGSAAVRPAVTRTGGAKRGLASSRAHGPSTRHIPHTPTVAAGSHRQHRRTVPPTAAPGGRKSRAPTAGRSDRRSGASRAGSVGPAGRQPAPRPRYRRDMLRAVPRIPLPSRLNLTRGVAETYALTFVAHARNDYVRKANPS